MRKAVFSNVRDIIKIVIREEVLNTEYTYVPGKMVKGLFNPTPKWRGEYWKAYHGDFQIIPTKYTQAEMMSIVLTNSYLMMKEDKTIWEKASVYFDIKHYNSETIYYLSFDEALRSVNELVANNNISESLIQIR
jgi:hypothetical protein